MKNLAIAVFISLLSTLAFADGSVHGLSKNTDGSLNVQLRTGEATKVQTDDSVKLSYGTWTTSYSALTNLSAIGMATTWSYFRVGDMVTIFNEGTITPTAGGTNTSFEMTIPIAVSPAFTTVGRVGGSASNMDSTDSGNMGCRPKNASTDTIIWQGVPTTSGVKAWSFSCSYQIN